MSVNQWVEIFRSDYPLFRSGFQLSGLISSSPVGVFHFPVRLSRFPVGLPGLRFHFQLSGRVIRFSGLISSCADRFPVFRLNFQKEISP